MKKPIKIIKRGRRTLDAETPPASAAAKKTENQVRREIVQTVTEWIEDRRAGEFAQRQDLTLLLPKRA